MSDYENRMAAAKAAAVKLGLDEPDDGKFLAKEYGVGCEPEKPPRDLEVIEGEILFYKRQAGGALLEIGRRLNEAKSQLNHGEWLPWLREKVDISERSAQDFMRLAREYSKAAEFADLGASKALALLALSPSERSEFLAEKHTVSGQEKTASEMTIKELKEAIRERDEARKALVAAKAETEVAEAARAKMEADMRQLKELQQRSREAEEEKSAELRRVEAELEALRKKPVDVAIQKIQDPEAMEKAKADGAAEAEKKHKVQMDAAEERVRKLKEELRKAREETKAATLNFQQAEREAKAARSEAQKAGKMAQVNSNQNMVRFGILFDQAQSTVNQMAEAVNREPAENQARMRKAMQALADAIRKAAVNE